MNALVRISKALAAATLLCAASGCINLLYVRNPASRETLRETYQSTSYAAVLTCAVSFPGSFVADGKEAEFDPISILTIPFLGIPCLADTLCEGVIDTLLFPADYLITR